MSRANILIYIKYMNHQLILTTFRTLCEELNLYGLAAEFRSENKMLDLKISTISNFVKKCK
jgi:hypothetical protein